MACEVLISFGAACGGFNFALALREDVYGEFPGNGAADDFCYLDAVSLRRAPESVYLSRPKIDGVVMRNSQWESYYLRAMRSCSVMVLLITEPWTRSRYCWQELDWLVGMASPSGNLRKAILVEWPDARPQLDAVRARAAPLTAQGVRVIEYPVSGTSTIAEIPKPDWAHCMITRGDERANQLRYQTTASERAGILRYIRPGRRD